MYLCGLRCSEVVNLRIVDIFPNTPFIRITNSKSLNDRLIPVPASLNTSLQSYLEIRKIGFDRLLSRTRFEPSTIKSIASEIWTEEFVFASEYVYHDKRRKCFRHKQLSRSQITKILKFAAVACNLNRSICPHSLRRSFATNAYRAGINIPTLQIMLGHRDVNTTSLYIEPFEKISNIESPLDSLANQINSSSDSEKLQNRIAINDEGDFEF